MKRIYTFLFILSSFFLFLNHNADAGIVSGSVFNDLNGNGSKNAGEPGLPGWNIRVTGATTGVSMILTTDGNGNFTTGDIANGNYTIVDSVKQGSMQTLPAGNAGFSVIISATGDATGKTFGIFIFGSISGMMYEDGNDNGMYDSGEQPFIGDSVFLGGGGSSGGTITDPSGFYSFDNLTAGFYTVGAFHQGASVLTEPSNGNNYTIPVVSGTNSTGNNFGYFLMASISGRVFLDYDEDGFETGSEQGLQGWTILLQQQGSTIASTVSDVDGAYSFNNISAAGSYNIVEQLQNGWVLSYPLTGEQIVDVYSGSFSSGMDFGNFQYAGISGMVFNDLNDNGSRDAGESGLEGWTVKLFNNSSGGRKTNGSKYGADADSILTDVLGQYSFSNLLAGSYIISEVEQHGWHNSSQGLPYYELFLNGGDNFTNNDFGNFHPGGVVAILPQQNRNGVLPNVPVGVEFLQSMDVATFDASTTFVVTGSASGRHSGSFTFSQADKFVTFNPSLPFVPGEVVQVVLSTNLHTAGGAPIASFTSQFFVKHRAATGLFYDAETDSTNPPGAIAAGDVDGDGDLDYMYYDQSNLSLNVMLNDGTGHFVAAGGEPAGFSLSPSALVTADLNNDGLLDVLGYNNNGAEISIIQNLGNGDFLETNFLAPQDGVLSGLAVADVNGDGMLDIVASSPYDNFTRVFINIGGFQFDYPIHMHDVTYGAADIATGDLNDDGSYDVAVVNGQLGKKGTTGFVTYSLSDGSGGFVQHIIGVSSPNPQHILEGDFNNDGNLDIVVADQAINEMSLLVNDGTGNFNEQHLMGDNSFLPFGSISLCDVNGDGNMDIAFTNETGLYILFNNGSSGFSLKSITTPSIPTEFATGDVDGDGDADLMVGNSQEGAINIMNNINYASISGIKFNDVNHDGKFDVGEPGIANWQIELVGANSTGVAFTDNSGGFNFNQVTPGNYVLQEKQQSGWIQTFPVDSFYIFNIQGGESYSNKNFGNTKRGAVVTQDSVFDWTDSSNWFGGQIPGAGDSLVIPTGYTVNLDVNNLPTGSDSLGYLNILNGASVKVLGNSTFNIVNDVFITGNFSVDTNSTTTFNVGGNFFNDGAFDPGHSTIIINNDTGLVGSFAPGKRSKQRGGFNAPLTGNGSTTFFNLTINGDSVVSGGKVIVQNSLTLNGNVTVGNANVGKTASPDTIEVTNNALNALTGSGTVVEGVIKRAIGLHQTGQYRFHAVNTYVQFSDSGDYPKNVSMGKFSSTSNTANDYHVFKGGVLDTVAHFVKVSGIKHYSRWTFGQVGYKQQDTLAGPSYDINADGLQSPEKGGVGNGVASYTSSAVSLTYNPSALKGIPQHLLGLVKSASGLKIKSVRDVDGNAATTNDRSAKAWGFNVYRGSVAPGNLVAANVDTTLIMNDEGPGTFIVAEQDSSLWRVIQHYVNATGTTDTAHRVSVSLTEGKLDSVIFVNYKLDLTKFRTFNSTYQGYADKPVKFALKKKAKPGVGLEIKGSGAPNLRTAVENVYTKLAKNSTITFGVNLTGNSTDGKTHGWLALKGSKGLSAFLVPAQTGVSLPIDSITHNNAISSKGKRSGKAYTKGISLTSAKTAPGNRLWAEGVLLKFNIAASQNNVTPANFGTLQLDTALTLYGRNLNGVSLITFSSYLDSLMTFWKELNVYDTTGFGAHSRTWTNAYTDAHTTFDSLAVMIKKINDGFYAPLDTTGSATRQHDYLDSATIGAKNAYGLFLAGVKSAKEAVSFLKNPAVSSVQVMDFSNSGSEELPLQFALRQNYPNPFNPTTTIDIAIPENMDGAVATLTVYNVLGQQVATIMNNEVLSAGDNNVTFDASRLSSGVYFYRLSLNGGEITAMKKMMLLK